MSGSSSRRGPVIGIGAVVLVAGLVGAVLLWNSATQRRNSTIEQFARAPIGCDTTLDFIEPGEYVLFVETVGTLEGVRGDCDIDGAFDSSDAANPDVDIRIVDPDGADVDLDRSFDAIDYDAAGFAGTARFSIEIEQTDDHVLRAESDADSIFVIAVGRDPNAGVGALRVGAVLAAVVGLLVGMLLILLGARRRTATVPAGPWTPGAPAQPGMFLPGGPAPQGPPVYGQPGGPPVYGQPQYGQQPAQPQYPAQQPQYPQPQYPAQQPQYPQPQYPAQQPPQPQYPQPQYPVQQPPQPQYQQPEVAPPRPPSIPGQPAHPGAPQVPSDPAGSVQPIEWAPQTPAASATAPPDEEFLAQFRDERATQERPPPPPPE